MEAMPLAIVTVLPLSVSVTLAPVPVPPPGMFAKTGTADSSPPQHTSRLAVGENKVFRSVNEKVRFSQAGRKQTVSPEVMEIGH